jgi:hypothetical protein
MIKMKAGVGPSLVCIMILGMLAACSAKPANDPSPTAEIQEVRALVQATSHHPSLVDRARDSGPPIHVDPYPKSAGHPRQGMAGSPHVKTHA